MLRTAGFSIRITVSRVAYWPWKLQTNEAWNSIFKCRADRRTAKGGRMKKKMALKKLTLTVETLRLLENGQLEEAVGASIGSCVETACPRTCPCSLNC
jgi:hypothetical protein